MTYCSKDLEAFSYEPIDLERPALRLLRLSKGDWRDRISGVLFQAYLDGSDMIPYQALSYTWGGTDTSFLVKIDGKMLGVTENLYIALHRLRKPDFDVILWIDAVCINQRDLKERGHQVEQMGNIYSRAEEVLIWLGPATSETDVLMDSLSELKERSLEYACRDWKLTDKRWTSLWLSIQSKLEYRYSDLAENQSAGLRILLRQPWFERVWILQEVANAQRATILSGRKSIPAYFFTLAPLLVSVPVFPHHCQAVLDIMPGSSRNGSWWNESRDLRTLLQKFRGSKASDPRDLVYALLGISSDAKHVHDLQPDYTKSSQEVVCTTASFILGRSEVSHDKLQQLIRWLPSLRKAYYALRDTSRGNGPEISLPILETLNYTISDTNGKQMLEKLLKSYGPSEIPIRETTVLHAAKNHQCGPEILECLLQQRGIEIEITDAVLIAAASNRRCGKQLMEILLKYRGPEIRVSSGTLSAAAGNTRSGKEIVELFLQKYGSGVPITQAVIGEAAANRRTGQEMIELFMTLPWKGDWIGREALVATARFSSKDAMRLLLERTRGLEVAIFDRLLVAATANGKHGREIMTILLDQEGLSNVELTPSLVAAAVANKQSGKDIFELLLRHQQGAPLEITQKIAESAGVHNIQNVLAFLLDCSCAHMRITQDVVVAAAGNRNGGPLISLLLDRYGADIEITEEVLLAAASNRHQGKEIMSILLSQHGAAIQISQQVRLEAAKNQDQSVDITSILFAHMRIG
ncbi:unnamed protein product [Periconia digitata]|uniref:Heterokaryon incompatibility domain-containing protein n=1 Tax=Periconia digitata TaxID=1303443 RepID=A0A9W4UHR6_9PLEO|nr:unnamed protein product [Periconia digitata]